MFHPVRKRDVAEIQTFLNHHDAPGGEQRFQLAHIAPFFHAEITERFVQSLTPGGLLCGVNAVLHLDLLRLDDRLCGG